MFPTDLDTGKIAAHANTIKQIQVSGHQVMVVIGGGQVARKYIDIARTLGASEFTCDLIGIAVSRLNARLFIASLGNTAYPQPVTSLEEVLRVSARDKIIVLGGLQPGQSTNAVAGLVAEASRADLLVNATDVDGVYTADPDVDVNAQKLDVIRTDALLQLLLAKRLGAGSYTLFDPVAIKIVERSRIPTRIIDGRNAANLLAVVQGKDIGTLILSTQE